MNQKLRTIQKTFIVSIVGLAVLSVVSLGAVLYATNAIEIKHDVSSSELHSLTKNYPAVESYLQTQKHAEPHFIKIANLVKTDQQTLLGRALLFTGVPMLLLSGLIAYTLARRLVKPVEETFAAQERFLQDASHEMRNPLAALSAVIQEARNAKDPKDIKRSLDTLDRQSKQLVKLNEDLLTLERSKTNHSKATLQDISSLLLDVIDSEYAQASQRGIKIQAKVTKNIQIVISDTDWVCIARNLIDNAVKYSRDNSVVSVTLTHQKQSVILKVRDRGIGIPADQLSQIGERFYRGTNVGRISGTGLGLAIVSETLHAYGGSLSLESKPAKGTTVTAVLSSVKK